MPFILVDLTPEQQELVRPVMDAATRAANAGFPGICLAQVFGDHMAVGFLPHHKVKWFKEAVGEKIGGKCRTAHGRSDSPVDGDHYDAMFTEAQREREF